MKYCSRSTFGTFIPAFQTKPQSQPMYFPSNNPSFALYNPLNSLYCSILTYSIPFYHHPLIYLSSHRTFNTPYITYTTSYITYYTSVLHLTSYTSHITSHIASYIPHHILHIAHHISLNIYHIIYPYIVII